MAGAAGGGGVDGQGALVEPRAFVGCQLTPSLGIARRRRPGQGASAAASRRTVVDLSLTVAYGVSSGL